MTKQNFMSRGRAFATYRILSTMREKGAGAADAGAQPSTMLTTFPELEEIVRIPSPAPAPQALACDGEHLWLGSWETSRVYGIDAHQGRVFEEAPAPGRPVGATVLGDDLRFIRRYVPAHGFKSHEAVQCPDDTGSFLAFDGTRLWLSQRFLKRVH